MSYDKFFKRIDWLPDKEFLVAKELLYSMTNNMLEKFVARQMKQYCIRLRRVMVLASQRATSRYKEAHEVITCSPDCTSTSYTSWSKRNKRNSPTASTYAFPTNYRFIVRSFSLLHEPVLSRRSRDVCRMILCSRKTFIDARVAKLCGLRMQRRDERKKYPLIKIIERFERIATRPNGR